MQLDTRGICSRELSPRRSQYGPARRQISVLRALEVQSRSRQGIGAVPGESFPSEGVRARQPSRYERSRRTYVVGLEIADYRAANAPSHQVSWRALPRSSGLRYVAENGACTMRPLHVWSREPCVPRSRHRARSSPLPPIGERDRARVAQREPAGFEILCVQSATAGIAWRAGVSQEAQPRAGTAEKQARSRSFHPGIPAGHVLQCPPVTLQLEKAQPTSQGHMRVYVPKQLSVRPQSSSAPPLTCPGIKHSGGSPACLQLIMTVAKGTPFLENLRAIRHEGNGLAYWVTCFHLPAVTCLRSLAMSPVMPEGDRERRRAVPHGVRLPPVFQLPEEVLHA